MAAQVHARKSKSSAKDDAEPVVKTVESHYVMKVDAKGGKLRVSYTDFVLETQDGKPLSEEERRVAELMTRGILPAYLVSPQGDFVALDDPEPFVQALRQVTEQTLPDDAARQRAKTAMDKILSVPLLTAMAKGDWDWMIGAWSGTDRAFDIGQEYISRSAVPFPLLRNALVETETRFLFKRLLPCERGGVIRECVEVIALNKPNPEKLAPILTRFAALFTSVDDTRIDKIETEVHVEVVLETETLLPHRFSLIKDIGVAITDKGKQIRQHSIDDTALDFTYPAGK